MFGELVSYIFFNIIQCPANPMILGLPWFELHNLDVDWNLQRIFSKHKKIKIQPLILGARIFTRAAKKNGAFVIYAIPMDISIEKGVQEISM
jgi:hypothetical protein